MRTRLLVVVAVLVVFAGCNGVLGGGDEPTATVTPAAVPTDRPTATAVPELAPGLTRQGIEDPETLLAAHAARLDGQSFTTRSTSTLTFSNGSTVPRGRSVTNAGPSGETVRLVVERPETGAVVPTRTEAWQRDTELFVNQTYANGTTVYNRVPVGSEQRVGVYGAESLEYLLDSTSLAATSVTEHQRNGTTVYDVRASMESETAADTTVELVVGPDGVIYRYRVTQATLDANESATATTVVRYDDIGTAGPPDPPAWLDTARNRTAPDRPTPANATATTNTTGTTLTTGATPATTMGA